MNVPGLVLTRFLDRNDKFKLGKVYKATVCVSLTIKIIPRNMAGLNLRKQLLPYLSVLMVG